MSNLEPSQTDIEGDDNDKFKKLIPQISKDVTHIIETTKTLMEGKV